MKTFKKECKHSQFEREQKHSYTEKEKGDGCWQCGGVLVLEEKDPCTLDMISMDDAERQHCIDNPEEAKELLDAFNQPTYCCPPCMKKLHESWKDRKPEEYIPIEKLIEELHDGTWDRQQEELRKEIEACGPDCILYERFFGIKS